MALPGPGVTVQVAALPVPIAVGPVITVPAVVSILAHAPFKLPSSKKH